MRFSLLQTRPDRPRGPSSPHFSWLLRFFARDKTTAS